MIFLIIRWNIILEEIDSLNWIQEVPANSDITKSNVRLEMKVKLKEDYNVEFRNAGGSVSKQRKNYPDQEHQANDRRR